MAGREGGECKRIQTRFLPSYDLKQLRLQRRVAENRRIKKELSFQIARLQRRKLRKWKSSNLQMHLRQPNQWKLLQRLHVPVGAVALSTLLVTTVQHARDQGHFEAEAPLWSEQQPAFARSWRQSHYTHPTFTSQHPHSPPHRQPTY